MITHRLSTKIQPEPPVRFYKTIAITFLILTIVLLGVVVFFTSKKVAITIVTKTDNKNVNLAVDVNAGGTQSIKGTVTSTIFHWSEKYYPTSNKSVEGVAEGQVTIYNDSGTDQPLVQTTRLLTSDGILFRLFETVNVPANGKITTKVYADKPGMTGDIGPNSFTIPGLNTDRQQYVYAKSTASMSGGVRKVGVLTNEDLQAAKNSFALKVQQACQDSIKNTLSKDLQKLEKVLTVSDSVVESDTKSGEQTAGFTISGTSTIVMVFYDKTELQSLVSKDIYRKVDSTLEKILLVGDNLQVSLVNYNLVGQTARLSVYQDVLVTLDADGNKLAPANFYNKSKDEIQRYIMGLSHVVGVDIKFSPTWMRKSPAVQDKIKVTVKNVK